EAELLVGLQPVEVAEHFGDVVDRARLDLVHEAAVTAVPGLIVECNRSFPKNIEDFADLLLADNLTETDGPGVGHRHHDLAIGIQDSQYVKLLPHDGDVAHLELDVGSSLHSVSLSDPRPTRSFNRKPRAVPPS